MPDSIIRLENVNFAYDSKTVLNDVNLEIKRGTFMGLVGPNGGGKTTIIKIILGLLKPDSGKVFINDQPIQHFNDWSRIGFVSQKANAFNKGFPATVFDVVSMGLTSKLGYFRFLNKKNKQQLLHVIYQVGILDYAYKYIGDMSGVLQQRVFI